MVRKHKGKRQPARPKSRLEDNSKLDLEKKRERGLDISGYGLVAVMNLRDP
jgi:hypothetical protein